MGGPSGDNKMEWPALTALLTYMKEHSPGGIVPDIHMDTNGRWVDVSDITPSSKEYGSANEDSESEASDDGASDDGDSDEESSDDGSSADDETSDDGEDDIED